MRRKGQWFLIGGFILAILFFSVVMSKTQIQIGPQIESWSKYVFDNLRDESQEVVNIIMEDNATSANLETKLETYIDFIDNYTIEHGTNLSGYFIVGLPANGNLNVTVANFLKNNMVNLSINIDNQNQQLQNVEHSNITSVVFSSAPNYFTVRYNLTFLNSTSDEDTESEEFEITKRVFSIFRIRIESDNEIWQTIKVN